MRTERKGVYIQPNSQNQTPTVVHVPNCTSSLQPLATHRLQGLAEGEFAEDEMCYDARTCDQRHQRYQNVSERIDRTHVLSLPTSALQLPVRMVYLAGEWSEHES